MKDQVTAGVLALVFGSLGIHRFYLGQFGLGILYLVFFFTMIPGIIGFIDGIILLTMDKEVFNAKYNRNRSFQQQRHYQQYNRQKKQSSQRHYSSSSYTQRTTPKPQNKTNPFKESAIKKYKNYDFEGAIEDFKKSLRVQPKDPVTHFNLACAYSLTEEVESGYFHLSKAVEQGYVHFDKVQNDGDLAFLRIQDDWEDFVKRGYKLTGEPVKEEKPKMIEATKDKPLEEVIAKIEKLGELREKGFLSEEEFQVQKEKLLKNL
ncbi:MAG: NINE protein [Bacteroidota bacterium]